MLSAITTLPNQCSAFAKALSGIGFTSELAQYYLATRRAVRSTADSAEIRNDRGQITV